MTVRFMEFEGHTYDYGNIAVLWAKFRCDNCVHDLVGSQVDIAVNASPEVVASALEVLAARIRGIETSEPCSLADWLTRRGLREPHLNE